MMMNTQFINNTALTIISARFSSVVLHNTTFNQNFDGNCISLSFSNANISNCYFIDNIANSENTVGVYVKGSSEVPPSIISNTIFEGNRANGEGGILYTENARVTIANCQFINNTARSGGSIYVKSSQEPFNIIDSVFISNEAEKEGGAIYCKDYTYDGIININGGYSILNSAVEGSGGFVYLSNCQLSINDHYYVNGNRALNGGAMYAQDSFITIPVNTKMANNTAVNGGALYLDNSFLIILEDDSVLTFDSNVAEKGGAIYIVDKHCEEVPDEFQCYIQDGHFPRRHLIFTNNSASQGPVLYGGLFDRCIEPLSYEFGIDRIKNISEYQPTPMAITSDPVRVCICSDDFEPNCTTREVIVPSKMRGQTVDLIGTVVDQNNNPKPSFLRARYGEINSVLDKGEGRRAINKCSNLSYHIFTSDDSATLILSPEGFCERSKFSTIAINITVIPCLRGFEKFEDRCGCDRRLTDYFNITVCNIATYSIQRKGSIWLRYRKYLKVHTNCPLGYCQVMSDSISLAYPDQQCADDRGGVICGACRSNYSIGLGGSKCLWCTNSYNSVWLVPLFAVAGIALVALLLVCNMTISHGTLNGLVFYANVVSIAGLTSLQNCSIHPILSAFIAWVNLDFGVETCFYSGMDIYQKTWLQFAFPLYIWLLVGAIVLISHCSATAMKLFGRNNMAVLATLFLLSYTKILKTIITALNFTEVLQGSANDTTDQLVPYKVWTYDGNIDYLKGKHVPLFAVALVLMVFLFLPYTLLLTFGQCIRSMPTRKGCILWCIHSTTFVSIMDAYHAPYNKRHRYWTGLMLLARCILFLVFAFSYNDSKLLVNTYITVLIMTAIFTLKSCIPRVYKYFGTNLLELSFLLNLMVLSSTLLYLRETSSSDRVSCQCTSASISVSMIMFIGILIYHANLQLKKTRCFMSLRASFLAKWYTRLYDAIPVEEDASLPDPVVKVPTTTTVELREELLEGNEN